MPSTTLPLAHVSLAAPKGSGDAVYAKARWLEVGTASGGDSHAHGVSRRASADAAPTNRAKEGAAEAAPCAVSRATLGWREGAKRNDDVGDPLGARTGGARAARSGTPRNQELSV